MTAATLRGVPGRRRVLLAGCAAGAGVEAVTAWRVGWSPALPAYLYLGGVGTAASVIDWRTRRIPNALLWPSYAVTVALLAVAGASWWPLARAAIAAAVVAGFLLAEALAFPRQLGLADVYLGALLGLGLGFLGLPTLWTGLLLGWLLAEVVFLTRRATGRTRRGAVIPLGPYLCCGALLAVVVR